MGLPCLKIYQRLLLTRRVVMESKRALADAALEQLENNPYFEKYAKRIADLQQTSPEEFVKRAEAVAKPRSKPGATPDTRQYSSVLNPKQPLPEPAQVEDKKLESIFKLDLVKDSNAEEIRTIWEEYHKMKEVISAAITTEQYSGLCEQMRKFPTFLFPLPRSQGYEFIMSQVGGNTVHFTPLLAYQVHKENAPECLTMVHYTELSEKGIVLMRGEYDKNVLNGQEAQCLANQFQMYYSGKDSEKLQLLHTFAAKPDSFKHMDLIEQMEKITLT